jgi:adenosylcobalamin-dependent ribonucleoside-triphosphate reductase
MGVTTPARGYFPGMGQAVADRTVNRKIARWFDEPQSIPFLIPRSDKTSLDEQIIAHAKSQGYETTNPGFEAPVEYHVAHGDDVAVSGFFWAYGQKEVEKWADVAARVALGNSLLDPRGVDEAHSERNRMEHHLRQASLLMSGRHLQHGDATQPTRNMEVFTNCSTSASTFLMFYLLLNGSGVGRAYDDAMIKADLNKMPIVVCSIGWGHKDVADGVIAGYPQRRDVEHLYAGRKITVFEVPDSREGWAKAIEIIERMAFEERREEVLILDFSGVRPKNSPINGMQGRPASGPGPLMAAIMQIAKLRDAGMAPWRAALFADHYAAECVLVGGARRAARMATKHWKDKSVLDFIQVKRGGFLWSSNNSVTVDQEFRDAVKKVRADLFGCFSSYDAGNLSTLLRFRRITETEAHAWRVMSALAEAAYYDQTGEPGLINQDRLTQNTDGLEGYLDGLYAESAKFKLDAETMPLMRDLAKAAIESGHAFITNPCGEIVLFQLGGYCVIADVVPFHAGYRLLTEQILDPGYVLWDNDAEDAFRTATRALIRTNRMDSLYSREVARTNRIGVGITGFHEWAYARFKFTWHDLVDEEKSKPLWLTMSRFKRAIVAEAEAYSKELGVVTPHTNTTFKPAGTTSKLFGLTEGAHLPSMREFIRWVQFRNDDPLVAEYEEKGFPIKRLKQYEGTTVVGFPTKPAICELDGGEWVVTAAEATPEEQYKFLELLERYWLTGVEEDGVTPLAETGNQISYTLKYDPKKVSFERFLETLIEGQFSIRACSVMPQTDTTAYEYQPEQPVTKAEFEHIAAAIQADDVKEDIGFEHVDCSTGACPVDFNAAEKAA